MQTVPEKSTMKSLMEKRVSRAEMDGRKIFGYAAVYGPLSEDLGGFRERVAPSAFSRIVEDEQIDVRALVNHDTAQVLGRRAAGTLKIRSTEHGLRVEIDPPETNYANDLKILLKRGDVSQMSFGFFVRPGGETWGEEDGQRIRTLTDVELIEVSVVTIPAYPDTSAALRSLEGIDQRRLSRERQLWLLRNRIVRRKLYTL
jgi:HK97 family phage prohead protease